MANIDDQNEPHGPATIYSKSDEPDYENLDLRALLDIERWIDGNAHPTRYARLRAAIAERRSEEPSIDRPNPKRSAAVSTKPLAIRPVVEQAFIETERHWRALLKALLIPAILTTALPLAIPETGESLGWSTLLAALSGAIGVMYAVSCHRILLVGETSLPNRYGIYWTQRETRFIGWSIAIGLLALFAMMPLGIVFGLDAVGDLTGIVGWLKGLAIYVPAAYVISRLSMVFPATAIDLRPSLEESWYLTRNNGWRLTVALALPGLLIYAVAYAFNRAVGIPEGPLASTFLALCFCLVGAVEITVLSVSFRFLSGPAGRGVDRVGP